MWYRHHADLATRRHCWLFYWECYSRPKTFGLDAIFPAILIALTFNALKNKSTRKAAFAGSTLALMTTPF